MSDGKRDIEKELAYYKRRVDELAGENLKLDYTISGLRHELKQKRQGFALLSELQPRVGADKQISSIFEATIEAINSTLGMDRTVVLAPEEENRYRPSHWLGFREDQAERLAATVLEFPAELAAGGVLIVNKATPRSPLIDRIAELFDLPFFIGVPVMGADAPIGLLLSGRLKEVRPLYPPLDQGDLDTFHAIAGLISASVRNMRVAVLEEMDRLKTDFFANISHEFRTPITLTIGPLEQLIAGRYGALPAPATEQLDVMRRNQERLLGLVSQILDLAKLEAGGMELRAALIEDVNRFVQDRVEQFRGIADKRGLDLRTQLDARLQGADIYLDREKFDKLLLNLLSNAVKFTRQGTIEVATAVVDGHFRVSVTDTGVGIKEDQLPHIFDRFRQADGSEAREFAGTGIGLALVQEVAKLHGGVVNVYSQYGRGTSFRVTVPLGREHLNPSSISDESADSDDDAPAALPMMQLVEEGGTDRDDVGEWNSAVEAAFDAARPTIVYAEDNPDLRRYLRDLLADAYNVYLAADGRAGLEAVRRYRPDLVISDQMMPNMSGRDLLRELRSDPELSLTPVVFLTARVGTDARIHGLDAGADDYLTKPFHEGELVARVRNLIRARQQERQLAELNRRLEARVEEQMAELVRSGELKNFLPPQLVESVLSGSVSGGDVFVRRKITILSAEIVGLAELTDQVEPEELSAVVNDCLRELLAAALAHGGTVDTSMAQRVTVLFGALRELEPDAQAWQAVQAALDAVARVGEQRALWQRRGIPGTIDLRLAINTGFCTVGAFGGEGMRSYTAVGAPVTVATLLQTAAAPGSIVCAFATHALVHEHVVAQPLGTRELPGVARPVEVFEVLGPAEPRQGDAPAGLSFLPR